MSFSTDIDIDFKDRSQACAAIPHIAASVRQKGAIQRHPSGVYLQDIPIHPFAPCSAIEYDKADDLGYFKIDLLTNTVYDGVRDKAHLLDLMNREVPWDFFMDRNIVSKLAHIHSHFGVVKIIEPKSVEDLAIVLALLRPAKKHLAYRPREEIDREIWNREDVGYSFKKSHAIAYAVSIVIQLNLLIERISEEIDNENVNVFEDFD